MTPTRCIALAAWMLCTAAGAAELPAEHGKAADKCENAVADTVKRMRGKDAQEVEFIGAKRQISPTPEEELGVKGEGRYRRPGGEQVSFSYSCAYNSTTGGTSGAMFRETGVSGAGRAAKAWEPDLASVSPEACESATAAALKQKYPRVGRIAFGSDSRKLRPAPNEHTLLEAQGAVERAPGMNLVPFTYRCEFESHTGKLLRVETSDAS
ncbi:hypothetical protein [Piscinibacter terrae]|nr:hypothetical protein [Albitalea terrae]